MEGRFATKSGLGSKPPKRSLAGNDGTNSPLELAILGRKVQVSHQVVKPMLQCMRYAPERFSLRYRDV